jgi:hypothetical protein
MNNAHATKLVRSILEKENPSAKRANNYVLIQEEINETSKLSFELKPPVVIHESWQLQSGETTSGLRIHVGKEWLKSKILESTLEVIDSLGTTGQLVI